MGVKEELEKKAGSIKTVNGGTSRVSSKENGLEKTASSGMEGKVLMEPENTEEENTEISKVKSPKSGRTRVSSVKSSVTDAESSKKNAEKMAPIKEGTVSAEKNPQSAAGAIRLLKADEIECRVSVVNEKGVSLLL